LILAPAPIPVRFFKQFEITRLSAASSNRCDGTLAWSFRYSALLSSRNVRDNVTLPLEELTDNRVVVDKIVDES
jgi:ABC-type transporter Mla maintaining outer membrane lipid asymmetry ATPase subunit MlaF